MKTFLRLLLSIVISLLFAACSSSRFVPEDKTLLSQVKIKSDNPQIKPFDYRVYVRQEGNAKWLNFLKVPLGIYCMSGTDSTKRFNRFMYRIGEAPVIYDSTLTEYSRQALEQALHTHGYLHAEVIAKIKEKSRKTSLEYQLKTGRRYYVKHLNYRYDNHTIRREVENGAGYTLYTGMPLDITLLDEERIRIIDDLRQKGYYNLNPEFITFTADTLAHDLGVNLTFNFEIPQGANQAMAYQCYRLGKITVHEETANNEPQDSVDYRGLTLISRKRSRLTRKVYRREIFQNTDSLYSVLSTQLTYQGLNSLPIVSYATVRYEPPQEGDSILNTNIFVNLNKVNGISFDLEGTNTAGDLGGAASLTYTNRNLMRGAEALSLKVRGAYEAIKGLEGYANQNYIEYGAEGTLRLPTIPVLMKAERKRQFKGTSDLSLLYNSQDRPEFHRRLLTGTWGINWINRNHPNLRNRVDLISLNYVFMPWISDTFRKDYLDGDDPRYAVLRYTYENIFITKVGYGFTYNSLKGGNAITLNQTNGYQIKMNVEAAGNFLYAVSLLAKLPKNSDGSYSLFNIPYSQYTKLDFDFSKSLMLDDKQSLAFHTAFGIAIPYGNSSIIPYEKRYFAGGANSVRGWSVRQLGPGSYKGRDGNIDFINQTGNVKLDLSMEYRSPIFWKFEGAAYIDAGNIWNTKNYADQPGGQFRWDTFYKQIAVSYGLGLRLNFNYFILRFDTGMKAIDPTVSSGRNHYPIYHPDFGRDFCLHFAVGLPF